MVTRSARPGKVSAVEWRKLGKGRWCEGWDLRGFLPLFWYSPFIFCKSPPPLCIALLPPVEGRLAEQGAARSILARCRRYHIPGDLVMLL
jgi:hypothetical protein